MQQDSNKKIENERPKASSTLRVENSSNSKKVENNHKEQPKHKDENQKGKEK